MKFLSLINRNYLLTIGVVLVITSFSAYFILQNTLTENAKEDILETEQAIINEIKTRNILPNLYPTIETAKVSKDHAVEQSFKEVMIKDLFDDGQEEPFLEYKNTEIVNGKYYTIIIRKSRFESEELMLAIAIPLLLLLFLAFLFSFLITRKLNKTVWKDFDHNLGVVKRFSFKNAEQIKLKKTNIQEFDELNNSLTKLTNKLLNDYRSLKDFTENASHEIQTPISIISVNLEELLQQDISEQTFKLILNTQKSLKRLSDLNKNLLVLTKIENHQFFAIEELSFNNLIKNKIEEFSALIKSKNLEIEIKTNGIFKTKISKELADILLNNLLTNAIKHNVVGGKIIIELNKTEVNICNTGITNKLTNQTIFNRFTKENSQSFGLGLAIVKQICNTHNIKIIYSQTNFHCFILSK